MAAKDDGGRKHFPWRGVLAAVLIPITLLLLVLLTWLILRPSTPRFALQNVALYALNLTSTNFLTTSLQATLAARNPNRRIGIQYDAVSIHACYRAQRITHPARLPPSYQGHLETTVWSPFLYGTQVPVAPDVWVALNRDRDRGAGTVLVSVVAEGGIRWKVGAFVSRRYHLYVNCPVYVNFGVAARMATFKGQLIMDCHVDA